MDKEASDVMRRIYKLTYPNNYNHCFSCGNNHTSKSLCIKTHRALVGRYCSKETCPLHPCQRQVGYYKNSAHLGHYKVTDINLEILRRFYDEMRKVKSKRTWEPIAEKTVEGIHSTLCSILSDGVEEGYLNHNPA